MADIKNIYLLCLKKILIKHTKNYNQGLKCTFIFVKIIMLQSNFHNDSVCMPMILNSELLAILR